MYLAPKVVLSSSSKMHNEHCEGCAIAVQLIYGPPWYQWGWGKWWPPLRNSKWIQILESLSCSILLDLLCRKHPGGRHRSPRRINQLSICAELLNGCGVWRGRSSRHVSLHAAFWEGEDTEWLGNCFHWLYFCQPKSLEKSSCLFRFWQRKSFST